MRTHFQLSTRRGLTRFVGRDAEMDAIARAAELAKAGHGQIVCVVAEPGVGKSRLFHEFKVKNQSSWMVLEAFSVSHGKSFAFQPVIDLLHSYLRIAPEDDTRTRREKVNGKVLTLDRKLEDSLPYLFGVLGLIEGDNPLAGMDARIRRQRTLEALKRVLLRESLNQPLMVIFEDLHWIDEETQAFLNLLADSIGTAKLLLLVTYRPDYSHSWGSKTYYIQLRLDPLGKEPASEMFDALLGANAQTIGASLLALKRLIIEKTEGTPLFIEEIYQALMEEGALTRKGVVKLTRPLNALKIPTTVQAILASRIDRLPAAEKELLQTLAVIGIEFPLELANAVIRKADDELDQRLKALQLDEFIYEQPAVGDVEYTFKHALTREVAYNSLLVERRKDLHERTAKAIEELYSDRLQDHLAELAHHYRRSANVPKAAEYAERAGEQARSRSAYADAIAHFRRGVELLAHLPEGRERDARELRLQNALASSLSATGADVSETEQAYIRGKELAERIGDARQLFAALSGLANFYTHRSDVKKALEVGQELLRMASAAQKPVALLVVHGSQAHLFNQLGDYRTSLEHANQGLNAFDSLRLSPLVDLAILGLDNLMLWCFGDGAFDLLFLGYPDQSLARCDEALLLARERGDPLALATALLTAAVVHLARGNAKTAREQAEMLLALSREHGFAAHETLALCCQIGRAHV